MSRLQALCRLNKLYAQLERMRAAEMQRAASAVLEVQRESEKEATRASQQRHQARTALGAGDQLEWVFAESERELAELRALLFMQATEPRTKALEHAAELHRSSRIKLEQVRALADNARKAESLLQSRREQAVMDDRYAARRKVDAGAEQASFKMKNR